MSSKTEREIERRIVKLMKHIDAEVNAIRFMQPISPGDDPDCEPLGLMMCMQMQDDAIDLLYTMKEADAGVETCDNCGVTVLEHEDVTEFSSDDVPTCLCLPCHGAFVAWSRKENAAGVAGFVENFILGEGRVFKRNVLGR